MRAEAVVEYSISSGGRSQGRRCGCGGFRKRAVAPDTHANDLAEGRDALVGAAALGVGDCVIAGPAEHGLFFAGEPAGGDEAGFEERFEDLFFDGGGAEGIVGVVLEAAVVGAEVGDLEGYVAGAVEGEVEGFRLLAEVNRLYSGGAVSREGGRRGGGGGGGEIGGGGGGGGRGGRKSERG